MSKAYEYRQLRTMLENPDLKSGLYLLDTELSDGELEEFIMSSEVCSYINESLIPSKSGSLFEMFVIGLSCYCVENEEIKEYRKILITADAKEKDSILYGMLILIMHQLCVQIKTVIHVCGECDLNSIMHEDLCKLDAAIAHNSGKLVIVVSKEKGSFFADGESHIRKVNLKEQYSVMGNKLDKVHISYKHDDDYESVLVAIESGLNSRGIPYSIDKYDILYKGNLDEYEKEIGRSDRIIMFVIPRYFKSLDCMFEMTEMFKNGHINERVFPLVDMGDINRNGDGLKTIKDFWQSEKNRKSKQISNEPGGSGFVIEEIKKIDAIIRNLDDFWFFICRCSTGDYEELIKNDAAKLMEELTKSESHSITNTGDKFVPTKSQMPSRQVKQGEKSIYIENNNGNVTIN